MMFKKRLPKFERNHRTQNQVIELNSLINSPLQMYWAISTSPKKLVLVELLRYILNEKLIIVE